MKRCVSKSGLIAAGLLILLSAPRTFGGIVDLRRELAHRDDCLARVQGLFLSYTDASVAWGLGGDGATASGRGDPPLFVEAPSNSPAERSTHLGANITAWKTTSARAWKLIRISVERLNMSPGSRELTDIRTTMTHLQDERKKLDRDLTPTLALDEAALSLLRYQSTRLSQFRSRVADEARYQGQRCAILGLSQILEGINAETEAWTGALAGWTERIERERVARRTVVDLGFTALRERLEIRYKDHARREITDIAAGAAAALNLVDLQIQFRLWLDNKSRNGSGGDALDKYYQYESALRYMRAFQKEILVWKEKMAAAPGSAAQKEVFILDADKDISWLESEIVDLAAKGWQGQFDEQKLSIATFRKRLDIARPECGPAIVAFEKIAAGVVDLSTFETAEAAFAEAVDSCAVDTRILLGR